MKIDVDKICVVLGVTGIIFASIGQNWTALAWSLAYTFSELHHVQRNGK